MCINGYLHNFRLIKFVVGKIDFLWFNLLLWVMGVRIEIFGVRMGVICCSKAWLLVILYYTFMDKKFGFDCELFVE